MERPRKSITLTDWQIHALLLMFTEFRNLDDMAQTINVSRERAREIRFSAHKKLAAALTEMQTTTVTKPATED